MSSFRRVEMLKLRTEDEMEEANRNFLQVGLSLVRLHVDKDLTDQKFDTVCKLNERKLLVTVSY